MKHGLRVGLTAVAMCASLVLPTAPAAAHADYRDSNPPSGGVVASPPAEVWVEFTEAPTEDSTLKIYGPCGNRVDAGNYSYQDFPINRITVAMSADEVGEYAVEWTVISKADSHTTRGVFTFRSTGGSSCAGSGGSGSGSGGGSGGSSGGGSNSGGSGSGSASGSASDSDSGSGSDSGDGSSTGGGKGKKGNKNNAAEAGSDSERRGVTLVQDQVPTEPPPREEELPVDWLLVGLAISALIGAAGGRIYAGITG